MRSKISWNCFVVYLLLHNCTTVTSSVAMLPEAQLLNLTTANMEFLITTGVSSKLHCKSCCTANTMQGWKWDGFKYNLDTLYLHGMPVMHVYNSSKAITAPLPGALSLTEAGVSDSDSVGTRHSLYAHVMSCSSVQLNWKQLKECLK